MCEGSCKGCDYDDGVFHCICTVCTRICGDEGEEDFYEPVKEIQNG